MALQGDLAQLREPHWKSPALALVNSEHWYGRGPDAVDDQLDAAGWLQRYLQEWRLVPDRPPSESDRRALAALRTLLRRLVTALAEGGDAGGDVARLGPYVERAPLRRRLVTHAGAVRVEYGPVRRDWDWVLAEIAASFVALLAGDGRDRIKVCANDECGWAFYDESRNRRRRWCDMRICGNVDKVRRFRARRPGRETAR